ncbi:MAG: 2-succinyl-5-enolpyruvyl-6-hydroxy-3-cyclohexene-1-carboxylic-acid synthase [Candidatus Zixiibacteriota bacterium]
MARDRQQTPGVPDGAPIIEGAESAVAVANVRCAAALIGRFAALGVRHVVISSGSRSTPLVLAASRRPGLDITTHPDERAAGFRALGIGKALRRPALLICTSGTAAANYYPAIIEARQSHTPLIALTADRPPDLRGRGAPQTINQVNLYAHYPCYHADLPEPQPGGYVEGVWVDHAARAYAAALGSPHGPVHLNVPFEEPLIPEPAVATRVMQKMATHDHQHVAPGLVRPSESSPQTEWDFVRSAILRSSRPLLVLGPQDESERPIAATGMEWLRCIPILPDVASQWRTSDWPTDNIISHYDLSLRCTRFAHRAVPDCVIRLGGLPTSRLLNEWLAGFGPPLRVLVNEHNEFADPYNYATHRLHGHPVDALQRLFSGPDEARCDPAYLRLWREADEAVAAVITADRDQLNPRELFEADVVAAVFHHAPKEGIIYLSNSMPIRWADAYAPARSPTTRVLVNRGANGIDGLISSAAGAASASKRTVVLVIGDIAFLHDLNGLWGLARERLNLKIVLLDNNGGGIFSHLPIAGHVDTMERLVAMPHELDLSRAAALFGIPWRPVSSLVEFVEVYTETMPKPGPQIIAVNSDRQRTWKRHRARCQQIETRLSGQTP